VSRPRYGDAVSDPGSARLVIDESSATPPFEQVRAQLAARISSGTLVVGMRLPPVRKLADELGLAVNTVARAYRELETAGLVETRGRGGTIVAARGDRALERVRAAAGAYAAAVHETGIDVEQATRIVRAALAAAQRGP
jgi:DNA-binding transcriptional regulator YhcF (GntR family)